jgi:hypothetical protein
MLATFAMQTHCNKDSPTLGPIHFRRPLNNFKVLTAESCGKACLSGQVSSPGFRVTNKMSCVGSARFAFQQNRTNFFPFSDKPTL